MLFGSSYIWVVNKDAAHPVGIAMTKKNPGHGKKPEQGKEFELLIHSQWHLSFRIKGFNKDMQL